MDQRGDLFHLHSPGYGSAGNSSFTVIKQSSGEELLNSLSSLVPAKSSTVNLSK